MIFFCNFFIIRSNNDSDPNNTFQTTASRETLHTTNKLWEPFGIITVAVAELFSVWKKPRMNCNTHLRCFLFGVLLTTANIIVQVMYVLWMYAFTAYLYVWFWHNKKLFVCQTNKQQYFWFALQKRSLPINIGWVHSSTLVRKLLSIFVSHACWIILRNIWISTIPSTCEYILCWRSKILLWMFRTVISHRHEFPPKHLICIPSTATTAVFWGFSTAIDNRSHSF